MCACMDIFFIHIYIYVYIYIVCVCVPLFVLFIDSDSACAQSWLGLARAVGIWALAWLEAILE